MLPVKYQIPLDIFFKTGKRTLLTLSVILLVIVGILSSIKIIALSKFQASVIKEGDYLVYVISNYPTSQLRLYDLATKTHTPILSGNDIRNISISATGRLAYSSVHEGSRAIYVLDYPFTNIPPVNVTGITSTRYYRMVWSPDGRYLAYAAIQNDGATLSIWDGKSSFQISHSPASIGELIWSPDGRLAFSIFFTHSSPYQGDSSEVFIWDENKMVNLSQNPTGEDRFPAWNEDGHLAFLSQGKGTYDIFVWDGFSMVNGVPDISTFNNIAPHLTSYYSRPVWTNTGSLTFEGTGARDTHIQIYEWDGKYATNISQNPGFHNGNQHWRNDGYWSFSTYFSSEELAYIRDEKNKTQLILDGYGVRWSESGYFIFCHRTITGYRWHFQKWEFPRIIEEYSGWTLSMGNGNKVVEIAHGREIAAAWANGESVLCSDG